MVIKDLIPVSKNKKTTLHQSNRDFPFLSLQGEMNRLFKNFFNDSRNLSFNEKFYHEFPKIDIFDSGNSLQITAELPGIEKKDLNIFISNNRLTIQGEKLRGKEEKKEHYYKTERSYGTFSREISLYCAIEEDKATAEYKNGVLKITLPKIPEKPKINKSVPIQIT